MATDRRVSPQQLANGLGWFSIGLGLAEIATPNLVANLIGVTDGSKTQKVLRFYGARELAAGFGILSQSNPSGWVWVRVAGDVVDMIFALQGDNCRRQRSRQRHCDRGGTDWRHLG